MQSSQRRRADGLPLLGGEGYDGHAVDISSWVGGGRLLRSIKPGENGCWIWFWGLDVFLDQPLNGFHGAS